MPRSMQVGLERRQGADCLAQRSIRGQLGDADSGEGERSTKAITPYPHIYFDDFLPLEVAKAALRDFPEPEGQTGMPIRM